MYIHCNMFELYIFDTFFNFQTFLEARASLPSPPPFLPHVPPPATGLTEHEHTNVTFLSLSMLFGKHNYIVDHGIELDFELGSFSCRLNSQFVHRRVHCCNSHPDYLTCTVKTFALAKSRPSRCLCLG